MSSQTSFLNPFRPGAGHMPPYLAGREAEKNEFSKLLTQKTILENMVLTGLRGVGKTVLLDTFKPFAIEKNWLWVGTDLSESASVSEENIAIRLLTDLSVVTSSITVAKDVVRKIGFSTTAEEVETKLGFSTLVTLFKNTPGLVLDKLKYVLEFVWSCLKTNNISGLIFAYDEAQNLSDQAVKEQYPLGILLDTFQSIQKKDIPFMLILTGLPTLFPKLVDSRTFAERMFRVVVLKRLREVYDSFLPKIAAGQEPSVPLVEITRKLDTDFFAGRWSRATDRQRELLSIIAMLDNCEDEFSVQEIVEVSKEKMDRPFSSSHVNQMLNSLTQAGLVYKNRHGKYSFAVPLLGQFIRRQNKEL